MSKNWSLVMEHGYLTVFCGVRPAYRCREVEKRWRFLPWWFPKNTLDMWDQLAPVVQDLNSENDVEAAARLRARGWPAPSLPLEAKS